ncbi:unnamed protein product [Hapterophycus canaliculatus]
MVGSDFMQAFVLVGVVVVLVVVCILFQGRPRPEAYSREELTQIRIDRELAKEEVLEEKAHQLKGRALMHRRNRLILSARKDAGRIILQDAQERWDARGRSIYGDAWDQPQDGNFPLRTLFNLPSEEIDSIREEARRLLQAEWPRSDILSLPYPPNHRRAEDGTRNVLGSVGDGKYEDQIMTAPASRGPTYSSRGPFIDARFVHQPTPAIVPPLDFARLGHESNWPSLRAKSWLPTAATAGSKNGCFLPAATSEAMCPMQVPGVTPRREEHDTIPGATATRTSIQDPGLTHPRPPSVPAPRAKRGTEGIPLLGLESLSARLARFAAGGTTARVVPIELV